MAGVCAGAALLPAGVAGLPAGGAGLPTAGAWMGATKAMERLTRVAAIVGIMWIMLFQEARYMHQAGQSLPPPMVLTLARPAPRNSLTPRFVPRHQWIPFRPERPLVIAPSADGRTINGRLHLRMAQCERHARVLLGAEHFVRQLQPHHS